MTTCIPKRWVLMNDIVLTDKLWRSCLASSSKQKWILAENKKEKVLSEKENIKKRLTEEIWEVLQQVEAVKATIIELNRKVAECYDKAKEAGADVQTIVAKGNALTRPATEKRKLVDELQIAAKKTKEERKRFWIREMRPKIKRCISLLLVKIWFSKSVLSFFPVWTFSLLSLFFGPASARSYKIDVVGDNWLVGKAVFSETARTIFLIFCVKLGDYKGRKVAEPYIWKKLLI